jgi:hypothetical protein
LSTGVNRRRGWSRRAQSDIGGFLESVSIQHEHIKKARFHNLQLFDSVLHQREFVLHQREPSINDAQFFPDQGAPHDQQYADRNRGKFYCHRSVSGFEGSADGSRVAVVTLLIRLTDRRLATPPHQDVRPLAGGLRLPARSDHFISRSTSTQAEVAMTTFAARTSGNNFPHLRQSAKNVSVSSRAIASIYHFSLRILGEGRSPPFCRFRPHAGFVSSGQIFGICCHADGRTVNTGFEEERKRGQNVLFPIRLDDAVMTTSEAWASKLRARLIGDFTRWKDHDAYKRCFERVVRDLPERRLWWPGIASIGVTSC